MARTMYELEQSVREDVRSKGFELIEERYYQDTLHQIADSNVPVYNYDKAMLLADNLSLAEVDDEGLIEGVTNVFDILAVSICEALTAIAYEEYEAMKEEYEELTENNDEKKDEYISDIEDAETIKEVKEILEKAKKTFEEDFPENDSRLEEVEEASETKIEELNDQYEDSKDDYISEIEDCETEKEVNAIIDNANETFSKDTEENSSRLKEVEKAGQEKIEELANSEEE